ncbi:MAG: flagellar basal-body rod protein FlgF [Rhodospirillales bacterium]|nr:flagellar basal-body rod protein FlgF [Alphaproteobacteria bacterium]MCB9987137.1 flagellar basal-body rod protein FlgF [Rhodospirillales bacterium]USO08106.1 MAG: flagellar basal-body rod protein FlgF [Rhodospirillales bacterium]
MENTIYVGLSRLSALEADMDVIANNIANVNTPGFKASHVMFSEYLKKPQGMTETLSMVQDQGTFRDLENGPIKRTDNALDVALEGKGYFGVQGPGGKTFYTRAGQFMLDTEGNLVTQQGYKVLDSGGASITLPGTARDINIDQTGQISTNEGQVASLMVEEFKNPQNMTAVGDSLYSTAEAGTPAEHTQVVQGAVEGSNTEGVVEMTHMIDVSRNYQHVARLLQNEHDRLRATIRALTQGQ